MWIGWNLQKDRGDLPGQGGSGAWASVPVSEVHWDEELEMISGHLDTWQDDESVHLGISCSN